MLTGTSLLPERRFRSLQRHKEATPKGVALPNQEDLDRECWGWALKAEREWGFVNLKRFPIGSTEELPSGGISEGKSS